MKFIVFQYVTSCYLEQIAYASVEITTYKLSWKNNFQR
jgi:hypothetical protein